MVSNVSPPSHLGAIISIYKVWMFIYRKWFSQQNKLLHRNTFIYLLMSILSTPLILPRTSLFKTQYKPKR
ncbi:hypothetical protein BY458DRAFT_521615 [Sporodiniella umbellata]|nr:hypothetical protein BY458DRAFT_521615 [Sporodiniella umbellata]